MEMNKIYQGNCLKLIKTFPDKWVNTIITSPPYWQLRDYHHKDQFGQEESPEKFIENLVLLFRECKRILKDDGTFWLNLGDSYFGCISNKIPKHPYLKSGDLCGTPWKTAIELQKDGWILRQDIIFGKNNPMPESVTNRCTKAHEYLFLFTKQENYYFDSDAIKEPSNTKWKATDMIPKENTKNYNMSIENPDLYRTRGKGTFHSDVEQSTRNKRSVWMITTKPVKDAHFAPFPEDLVKDPILAGSPIGGLVFDPFMGSGTVALVAKKYKRNFVGTELNPDFIKIAEKRIKDICKHDDVIMPSEKSSIDELFD
jgi:DNA modification methylase